MEQKWKRPLALLLSVAMMFSISGIPVYAADVETGTSVCPHHVHDETCGYSEGTPCTHEHTDDCYTLVTQCVHEHTAECYSDGILPAEGEEKAADACTHVCSEESGCITKELNCPHVHDETCGYSEGSPCTFDPSDCELCNPTDSGEPEAPAECACETLCTADSVNPDCPVCAQDIAACQGEAPAECACETLCTADSVNPDCPVCAQDIAACQGEAPAECTCETLCTADSVNPDCPVCAQDIAACQGEAPAECTCETLCTADSVNPDCPVCSAEGADLTACAGTVEEGDAAPQTVTAWEWIGADNLNEGVLPLPDVSAENPVDLATVVSMLPTGITATVDGSADSVELALTWSCGDFPETASAGEYTFTAALPEGYTLGEETASLTVPVILGLGLLPVTALAADEVSYLAYSWDGSKLTSEMKSVTDYTLVASTDTAWGAAGETTWYVADGDVSISNRVDVNGSVNLLLKDDCELSPNFIIISAGSTLTIYAQTEGETAGKLVCSNGIGTVSSTLIIHGGTVNATGTIGGRSRGETGGTVTIYGGTVTATGYQGAGIGGTSGGGQGGTVTIYGGTVNASGTNGAGIGGGSSSIDTNVNVIDSSCGNGGTVTIYGGTVNASGTNGAGIGGGSAATGYYAGQQYYVGGGGGTITINGGTVNATGTSGGIGAGPNCGSKDFTNKVTPKGTLKGTSIGLITGTLVPSLNTSSFTGLIKNGGTYTVYGNLSLDTLETPLSISEGENLSINGSLNIPVGKTVTVTNAGTIDCGSGKFVNNGTLYLDNSGTVNGTFGGSGVFLISVDLPDDTNDLTAFPDTFTYTGEDFAGQIFLGTGGTQELGGKTFWETVRTDGWTITYAKDGQSTETVIDAGEYTATFTPPEGETITRTFTVKRAAQTISAPEIQSQSEGAVTLKPVTGVVGKVEYGYSTTNDAASIDNWQESPTFNDMTYGTYYFFAKVTGDSNHEDAVSSTGTVVAFREISSISITSNPTKMLYTPGATLDLTGLKITVTYTDNSTAEVTWTADSGITASIPNGTSLTASHDGQTITITYGGKTAVTDSLLIYDEVPQQIDGVYQIGTVKELIWFAALVNGTLTDGTEQNTAANTVLTADIDLGGRLWAPIASSTMFRSGSFSVNGTTNTSYSGIFDGQGHIISNFKIRTNSDELTSGLFGAVTGTIENLGIVNASFDNGGAYDGRFGALCGLLVKDRFTKTAATIQNCYVVGSSIAATRRIAGAVCGANYGGTIEDCYECGNTVTAHERIGHLVGDNHNDYDYNPMTGTVTNCYSDTKVVGDTTSSKTGTVNGGGVKDAEEFASGEVAWLLNGSTSAGGLAWYQTLGERGDPCPVLDSTHSIVYCGEDCLGNKTYDNSPLSSGHNYDGNGFCTLGDHYQPADWNEAENRYEISNDGQLFWFAALVNGDTTQEGITQAVSTANAVLTADIDLSGQNWTPIGNGSTAYTGTFDGQGHTISGMTIENAASYSGLFGNSEGTIKSFTLTGSITVTTNDVRSVAGVAGYMKNTQNAGGTISDVVCGVDITVTATNTHHIGGIVGSLGQSSSGMAMVERCLYTGTLTASESVDCQGGIAGYAQTAAIRDCGNQGDVTGTGKESPLGGILGYCNSSDVSVTNCYNTGSVVKSDGTGQGAIIGMNNYNQATVSNCYWLEGTASAGIGDGSGEATSKNETEFASGEVCYLLNGSTSTGTLAWYQNLDNDQDKDTYPVLDSSHGVVYPIYDCTGLTISGYNNTATSTESHNYEDGFCTLCGGYQPANLNGDVYEIANAGQLFWFAALVNGDKTHAEFDSQNSAANAKLLNDITLNENVLNADGELNGDGSGLRVWTPMGSDSNRYVGTFDGNGHTIYGLYIPSGGSVGLVGHLGRGGVLQGITLADGYVRAEGGAYAGGICARNWGTIADCHNGASLVGWGQNNIGGICGCNEDGGIIRDCTNSGRIQGVQKVGGIVGWNYLGHTVTGCSNTGNIIGESNCTGGICGDNNESTVFANCTNTGTVNGGQETGGICGTSNRTLTGCVNTGNVTGTYNMVGGICGRAGSVEICANRGTVTGTYEVGGICGYLDYNGTLQSCYSTGTVTATEQSGSYAERVGSIGGYIETGSVANCYWLDGSAGTGIGSCSDDGTSENVAAKTAAEFASGEVTWLLNGSTSEGTLAWYQNLDNDQDKDTYPVLDSSHGIVYRIEADPVFYSNDPNSQPPVIISVDITWGELSFTYSDGTWNPDTHTYDGAGWNVDEEGGNSIKVENTGNTDVNVTYDYKAVENGITGSFTDGENPVSAPVSLPANNSSTVYLILAGKPENELMEATIGSVTVTIGGESE